MAIELSGLAQLVARLELEGEGGAAEAALSEIADSPLAPREWDPPVALPRTDPLTEIAHAVAAARLRLEALGGQVAELRRQIRVDVDGATRPPARPSK